MKSARHQAILDLIEQHPIDRQEDLLAHLREEGFDVTQAISASCSWSRRPLLTAATVMFRRRPPAR